MKPRLEAVVEFNSHKIPKNWEVIHGKGTSFIRLWANTLFIETSSVVVEIIKYSQVETTSRKKTDVLKTLIESDCLVVGGGLKVINGEKSISPGCCCGLEDWREWISISPEKPSIWLGHDPEPWIEYISESNSMRIWSDESVTNSEVYFIDFSYESLKESLLQVEKDLNDFLQVLLDWGKQFDEKLAQELVEKFQKDFDV